MTSLGDSIFRSFTSAQAREYGLHDPTRDGATQPVRWPGADPMSSESEPSAEQTCPACSLEYEGVVAPDGPEWTWACPLCEGVFVLEHDAEEGWWVR